MSYSTPPPGGAPTAGAGSAPGAAGSGTTNPAGGGTHGGTGGSASATGAPSTPGTTTPTDRRRGLPVHAPGRPGPGGTQALAENTTNGGVTYDVAYSVVTVNNGAPVTNTNSAYALAHCQGCTTVAVSFQIVLIVGHSKDIAPINAAGSLNYDCPACTTTAIADQLVVTLRAQPTAALLAKLDAALKQLNALPALGAQGTPAAVASQVAAVQQQVETRAQRQRAADDPVASRARPSASDTRPTPTSSTTATDTRPTPTRAAEARPPRRRSRRRAATTPAPAATTTAVDDHDQRPQAPTTTSGTTSTATTTTPAG